MAEGQKRPGTRKKKSKSFTSQDSMIFEMELEISKLKREKSVFVLNKAIFLYFFFIFLGVLALLTGYDGVFNLLVVLGLATIIIGSIPYVSTMYNEEKNLQNMVERLRRLG
ncbi:MAG: hypothetical protein ACLFTR_00950 [Candidatus Woesearchaeota archaeon]